MALQSTFSPSFQNDFYGGFTKFRYLFNIDEFLGRSLIETRSEVGYTECMSLVGMNSCDRKVISSW